MNSGSPPSSRASIRDAAALETERGNLRDSLGGLRNLAQLLHSLRVGSRPISNMLPDARDAVDPLRHAMHALLAAIKGTLSEPEAADSLRAYVTPRLAELEAALTQAAGRPLNVKLRLSLEECVTRLSQELDASRCLFDLLGDSIAGRPTRLDLLELSRQSFSGPPSAGSWPRETLVATLNIDNTGLEVEVDSRVAMSLIALGVELVANPVDASQIPRIVLTPSGSGCHVLIERSTYTPGEDLVLLRRGIIPPTLPCVAAAARANGAVLDFDADAGRFGLTFGKAFPSQQTGHAG